jgi:hypothetical protein
MRIANAVGDPVAIASPPLAAVSTQKALRQADGLPAADVCTQRRVSAVLIRSALRDTETTGDCTVIWLADHRLTVRVLHTRIGRSGKIPLTLAVAALRVLRAASAVVNAPITVVVLPVAGFGVRNAHVDTMPIVALATGRARCGVIDRTIAVIVPAVAGFSFRNAHLHTTSIVALAAGWTDCRVVYGAVAIIVPAVALFGFGRAVRKAMP